MQSNMPRHEITLNWSMNRPNGSLRIKDDEQGFDVENQAMRNGFGLLGMAERAEALELVKDSKSQGKGQRSYPLIGSKSA